MKKYKFYTRLVTLQFLMLALAACSDASKNPLTLGTNVWIGYEPLYLARELGYVDPKKIKLVEYVSATQVMRGLIDGSVNAGALTLDEAILLQQQGVDIQIVLVMDYSSGADAILARPGIRDLRGLKGKKIGAETSALGAYMLYRALEKAGLSVSDVNVIPLELSQHEQAYTKKKIDAVVTFDPVRSRLLSKGAVSLIDSSQLPGEIVDVLVVRKKVVNDQKRNIKELIKVWFKTLKYIQQQPAESAVKMRTRIKLSKPEVLASLAAVKFPDYRENQNLIIGEPSHIEKQSIKLYEVMLKNKLLLDTVEIKGMFHSELIQELYP